MGDVLDLIGGLAGAGDDIGEVAAATDTGASDGAAAADDPAGDSGLTCGRSFTAATPVLLASGAAVPISRLKPGDKVLATNVKTGKTQAEPVTAVLVHRDTDLYDLTVKTGHRTGVIHTTSSHLFWDPYLDKWVTANKLSKGENLKTPDGTLAVADSGTTPKVHDGWMWDLTVPGNNDHDFYVETAAASVLVHNSSCPNLDDLSASGQQPDPADAGGNLTRAGRAVAKHANLFPPVSGGPAALNEAGQNALDEILTNPNTVIRSILKGNFAGGQYFVGPNGIGAAFDAGGVFQYFGAMSP